MSEVPEHILPCTVPGPAKTAGPGGVSIDPKFILFVCFLLLVFFTQDRIINCDGFGYDGCYYGRISRFISDPAFSLSSLSTMPAMRGGDFIIAPFVYRLGLPALSGFIASKAGIPLLLTYYLIGAVAVLASMVYITALVRMFAASDTGTAKLVLLFAFTTMMSPFRWLPFYPASTDYLLLLSLSGGLYHTMLFLRGGQGRHLLLATAMVLLSAGTREMSGLPVLCGATAALYGAGHRLLQGRPAGTARVRRGLALLLPAALGGGIYAINLLLVGPAGKETFLQSALNQLSTTVLSRTVIGYETALGIVLPVIIVFPRRAVRFVLGQRTLAFFTAGIATLAVIGGTDYERFAYWSIPAAAAFLAYAFSREPVLKRRSGWFAAIVLAAHIFMANGYYAFEPEFNWAHSEFYVKIMLHSLRFATWMTPGQVAFNLAILIGTILLLQGLVLFQSAGRRGRNAKGVPERPERDEPTIGSLAHFHLAAAAFLAGAPFAFTWPPA